MQSTLTFLVNGVLANGPAGNMMRHAPGGFFLLLVLWVTRNWDTIKSYASRTASSIRSSSAPVAAASQMPLEILQTRYAKGEITREEYETIHRDLVGAAAPVPTTEAGIAQA